MTSELETARQDSGTCPHGNFLPCEKCDFEKEGAVEKDISLKLREALTNSRTISYEDYGERKVVSVEQDGRTYSYSRANNGRADWQVEIYDENNKYINSVDVREPEDVKFLEDLFKQDITENRREALTNSRTISYEDYGGRKVVSVEQDGRTYSYSRANNEYADWQVEIFEIVNEKSERVDSVDVREPEDVKFLEELFKQDITEDMRQLLRETKDVSYGERMVASVEKNGRTYSYSRANNEYADWQVEIYDENNKYITSVDVREPEDTEFLEELFKELAKKDPS